MTPRYLFLCPDRQSASGGIAVIHDLVALLTRHGYAAAVLHNSPGAGYPHAPGTVPRLYTRRLWPVFWRHGGPRQRLSLLFGRGPKVPRSAPLPRLALRPDDVVVAPEFQLAEALEAFPDSRMAVLVQNPFSLLRSFEAACARGLDPLARVRHWFGTSEVCLSHLELIGAPSVSCFPVSMRPEAFSGTGPKERLITYMPRKRPAEARLIVDALQRRGQLDGYRLEALDALPRAEIAARLARSRFFISLMKQESLGFPAAEAMASGCIVVGFDGLGGAEYFDDTTGIPVPEGDVAGLVTALERALRDHDRDPERFAAMCARAAARVRDRYAFAAFEAGALEAWQRFDGGA